MNQVCARETGEKDPYNIVESLLILIILIQCLARSQIAAISCFNATHLILFAYCRLARPYVCHESVLFDWQTNCR